MPASVLSADLPSFFAVADFGTAMTVNGGQTINVILSERPFDYQEGTLKLTGQPFHGMTERSHDLKIGDILNDGTNDYQVMDIRTELDIDNLLMQRL